MTLQSASGSEPEDSLGDQTTPAWIHVGGAFRFRPEYHSGNNFTAGDNYRNLLTRVRLNINARPLPWLRFFIEGQDSRNLGAARNATPGVKDSADIQQMLVQVGTLESTAFEIRAGRQEMPLGAQRLFGDAGWGNTGGVFDAVKLTVGMHRFKLHLLGGSPVEVKMTSPNTRARGNSVYGAYGVWSVSQTLTIEPYVLRHTRPDAARFMSIGSRAAARWQSGLEASGELVAQRGDRGPRQVKAYAWYVNSGYSWRDRVWQPKLSAEYGFASGDQQRPGEYGAFDQWQPGAHALYGLTDLVGWRNIRHLRQSLELHPARRWSVLAELHSLWLASRRDGLYNADGALTVRSRGGTAADSHIGEELDVVATYAATRGLLLSAGYGRLWAGSFLRQSSSGASYSMPYSAIEYRF